MKHFIIVGYGNTLRRDDGLGPLVVEGLEKDRMPPVARVRIASLPQLDVALVSELHQADVAIFVDARQDDDDALVQVDRIEPHKQRQASSGPMHSTHSMGLSALLGICHNWYAKELCCYLVKPKGFDFSIGETISEKGHIAAACAKRLIYQFLWDHCDASANIGSSIKGLVKRKNTPP